MVGINNINPGVSNKKSNTGAKIGAAAGIATGVVRTYMVRDAIKTSSELALASGHSKFMVRSSQAVGIAVAVAVMAGVGALIGAGIEKAVKHFKKGKAAPEQAAADVVKPGSVNFDNGE